METDRRQILLGAGSMIGLSLSIAEAATRGPGSITLSTASVDEDAAPGTIVGRLDVIGAGPGPWNFSLADDAGGRFGLAGADLLVGATPLDNGMAPRPVILAQATDGQRTLATPLAVGVRPRRRPVAQAGDLVFSAQANMAYPVRAAASQFVVAPGREHCLCETYLPAQPAGARVVYADSWGRGDGTFPVEYGLANGETIAWCSLMNGVNGTTRRADITFTEFGAAIPAGGFTLSDPFPIAVADGNALRTVISAPLGGQRMANNGYNIIGEQQRASATLSTFNTARTSQAASAVGGGIFNAEAFTATGIVAPRPAGYRSFLLIGTSIMRGQDTTYRFIQSPSRNAYGYLPFGLDSAENGRMGWWQAAIHGQNIAKQNEDAEGKLAKRFAILTAIAEKNAGRWPFTDIILDLRNDWVGATGNDPQSVFRFMASQTKELVASVKALFRDVPVHLVDCPPIQSIGSGFQASRFGTEPALQVPASGNHKAAAVRLLNNWIATTYAELGVASVIKAGSACCAPDDGSGFARWRQTPFTAAGGGSIAAADYPSGLAAGVNLATTGLVVAAAAAPEIGAHLALFDPDMANPEAIVGNANGFSGGYIVSATAAGAGRWLVKTATGSTSRARPAGSVARTTATQDGTHPSHWLHMGPMAEAVIAWKQII
ncbi:hypothetical protein [Bosea sp. TND4EK4]|uniref:hypothetical protein n=1 Tax=Bosea sp. TND4EK4 TaxID=1907408 RepID=UPI000956C3C1|nr:hypothetical protein [Bosea sp. TND4EK4]SIR34773.1 hypothetical protein SAMN05880592_1174 [Bosea sp. TND4EK4]